MATVDVNGVKGGTERGRMGILSHLYMVCSNKRFHEITCQWQEAKFISNGDTQRWSREMTARKKKEGQTSGNMLTAEFGTVCKNS